MSDPNTRNRWDARWRGHGTGDAAADAPARWLTDHAALLGPGDGRTALDVACGTGRNALWLAARGFHVEGVDISEVAVASLREAAARRGLPVRARLWDLERDGLPEGTFDLVVVIRYLQRDLFPALAAAVAPGGILVAETFVARRASDAPPPINPRFLLAPGELLTAFPRLRPVSYRERAAPGQRSATAAVVARRAS